MKRMSRRLKCLVLFLAACLLLTAFAGAAELQAQTLNCIHLEISLPEKNEYLKLGPPNLGYWMLNFFPGSRDHGLSIWAGEKSAYPLVHLGTSSQETIGGQSYTVYSNKLTPSGGTVISSSGDSQTSSSAEEAARNLTYYSLDYVTEHEGWKYGFSFQKTSGEFTAGEKEEISAIMHSVHYLSMDLPSFDDLKGHWAESEIMRAVGYDLFSGSSDGLFHPDESISRAMLAQVLYRMSGHPTPISSNRFSDVPDGAWYAKAAGELAAQGIIEGSNGRFEPNASVTREQLAVMLYRFAQKGSIQALPEIEGDLSAYSDANQVSSWAVDAMTWAVEQGLMTGLDNNTLSPKTHVTRAQTAAVLVRYLEQNT